MAKSGKPALKILMCASEAVPFAKTGGLADAVSSLSLALAQLGHEVKIFMPRYYGIDRGKLTKLEGALGVPMSGGEEWSAIYTTQLPANETAAKEPAAKEPAAKGPAAKVSTAKGAAAKDTAAKDVAAKKPVQVYFIDHENFFGRDGIYGTPFEPDFMDNPRRFAFFCRACFQLCRKIGWYPDVLHAHDWPAAMAPVYLRYQERYAVPNIIDGVTETGSFEKTVSLLTIHNLGYQGIYSRDSFFYTGFGWDVFYHAGFEDWNMMNLLKAGINSADRITTVSPTYARETLSQQGGFRLDGVLRYRGEAYTGILNGIDTEVWNPRLDKYIPAPYSAKDMKGKARAKEELQRRYGLPETATVPVIGMVCRLTDQKGIGELFGPAYGSAFSICRDMDIQFVFLGSGDAWAEHEISNLSSRLSNFKAYIGYDEEISHLIEAGSDFFLMPSRYEPCGLNQLYSLNYGTIPIVRNTGGLADTVQNYNQETGEGTGFMFDYLSPNSIYDTIGWAVWAWYNKKKDIDAMRSRGMIQDFSWKKSALEYMGLYRKALEQ
ncbi:MAG: glycogen synthase [Spirochaetaceae bacterium]|jgi:starch synthase|nr:glycogen synthase [Spirochaetaceae bacterium]